MKKIVDNIKNYLTVSYYAGYLTLVIADALFKSTFKLHGKENYYFKQYPSYDIGDLIQTDAFCLTPASVIILGSFTKMIPQKTAGWVVERHVDKSRPGSLVIYRVLFPEGLFWVSQTWLNKSI